MKQLGIVVIVMSYCDSGKGHSILIQIITQAGYVRFLLKKCEREAPQINDKFIAILFKKEKPQIENWNLFYPQSLLNKHF